MTSDTPKIVGKSIAAILLPYLCAVYVPRALHDPTTWNVFWAFFWVQSIVSSVIDSGIREARG